jgi:flagellar biosynthesis/type III secretory pathway protein FliH
MSQVAEARVYKHPRLLKIEGEQVPSQSAFDGLPQLSRGTGSGSVILREANEGLRMAVAAYDAVLARTKDLEAEIEAAREEARRAGFAEGLADARREMAGKLVEIERRSQALLDEAKPVIVDLALRVAREFIEVKSEGEALANLVKSAIRSHLARDPFEIRVDPSQHGRVVAAVEDLRPEMKGASLPTVVADKRLEAGRAVLRTRSGLVDIDLDSRLQAFRDVLLRS